MSFLSAIARNVVSRVHPVTRTSAVALVAGLALAVLTVTPRSAAAQRGATERRWRPMLELGATPRVTWLDGSGAPEITSGIGAHFAAGVQRQLTTRTVGSVTVRFHESSLKLAEGGATWGGGPLREFDVMAMGALQPRPRGALRFTIDGGAGLSQLHAPKNTLPFSEASRILPVAEIGASLRHGNADGAVSRSEFVLFARYSARLLRVNTSSALAEGGTIARVIIGVGVVR